MFELFLLKQDYFVKEKYTKLDPVLIHGLNSYEILFAILKKVIAFKVVFIFIYV